MDIYALVGRSGTGKSYKAQVVAGTYDIEYILDDGILIKGTKVLAGVSAKRESTRVAAIRRAIFLSPEHRRDVRETIRANQPDKLLIIGTSEHMIETIMKALELGDEFTLVRIEDISEPSEIESAIKARRVKGKHVIPVPTFEVKKDFSGYFIDSIRQFVRKNEKQIESYEKTVVRPTFSYLGKYEIKDGVLKTIASYSALQVKNVDRIGGVDIINKIDGIIITVYSALCAVQPLNKTANELSMAIKNEIEYMTGKNVLEVNVVVRNVRME